MRKLTTSEFINKAMLIHGNKYDYSLVEYNGCDKKVIINCKLHGSFLQQPNNHLSGSGCYDCGIQTIKDKTRLTLKDFIEKSIKIHGNVYDYTLSVYINTDTLLKIICNKHGIFEMSPSNHIYAKQGCAKCYHESTKGVKTKKTILSRFDVNHGDDYCEIPLTRGRVAIVDRDDYEYINSFAWYAGKNGYAVNTALGYMHRIINKTPENLHTDHIDGDKLNNRKSNLRSCTISENNRNIRYNHFKTSKYKGVSRVASGKWKCSIKRGDIKYSKLFNSEIEAAIEYNKKAKELHGEFANLNIIKTDIYGT